MSRKLLMAILATIVVILLILLFGWRTCCAMAQTEVSAQPVAVHYSGVFRNFVWEVSKEDVRAYEEAAFYKEEGDSLHFLLPKDPGYIPALSPMLRYDFTDGKLTSAQFSYYELKQPDGQIIIDLFTKHQIQLSAQFGKPTKDEIAWKNEEYKRFPQFWARALMSGDLRFKTTWVVGDTEVVLHAYRDKHNYKLFYTVAKIRPPSSVPTDILQLDLLSSTKP